MNEAVRPVSSAMRPIQSSSCLVTASSSCGTIPAIATSKIRPPPSFTALAIANSSSSSAKVPGTGIPSLLRWPRVRDVVKPNAPALIASSASSAIRVMSSGSAISLPPLRSSPITYVRSGPWGNCTPTSIDHDRDFSDSMYSGKLSHPHVMPSYRAVPGMSSTPSMRRTRWSSRPGLTGANPTPQFPVTTVVTPCAADGLSSPSHVTWPS